MRRPILPSRAMRRQLIIPARLITTKPATFANIKYELLQRPTRIYCEDLTPRNSHLLARSLQDFLPPEAQAPVPLQHPEPWELLDWGHHLVYFAPLHATTSLLPDGTDADHSPGPPFTRRVWAGGSIAFFHHRGTGLGSLDDDGGGGASVAARGFCTEEIEDVRLKGVPPGEEARTFHAPGAGEKVFVDLVRRIGWNRDAGGGGAGTDDGMASSISVSDISIVERRTLCFMVPSPTAQAGADVANRHERRGRPHSKEPTYSFSLTPTPALLFRFSALTLNAHAIHLDRQHCRQVEGFRDLLVHGPLLLVLMLAAVRGALAKKNKSGASILKLDYRNLAPVYVGEEMRVCVREGSSEGALWDVSIVGPEGGLCVKGTADVRGGE